MVDQVTHGTTDAVDDAINRVLMAEREAREAVEQCRGEAARILAAAEEAAREVSSRAEGRIQSVRGTADRAVERALAELRIEAGGQPRGGDASREGGRLDRAVDALIDEILGAGP
jgi:vacuolar-type H+-ATPase subunit H